MMPVSERRVCRVLGQHRSTQRKPPCGADDEVALTEDIIALARQYGRYGYRRVTALLRLPLAYPQTALFMKFDLSRVHL
jgi:putative transposase